MTSAVTKLGCTDVDGAVVGTAAVPADPTGFAADSVSGVNAAEDGPWTDVTVNALGDNVFRATGVESGVEVADDIELNALGGWVALVVWAALVVGEPLAPFGWDTLCVPGFAVFGPVPPGAVELGVPGSVPGELELADPVGELPPGDDGETVEVAEPEVAVVPPAPDTTPELAPAEPDSVGDLLDEFTLPV